jgi:Icc protein
MTPDSGDGTGPRTIRLLQVTDTHLFADESGELYGVQTWKSFRAVLDAAREIAHPGYDGILVTGDVAEDGRRETYERFREEMSSWGVPVLCIPGNHENRELMTEILGRPPFQYAGARDFGDWRVVMLESHVPGKDHGEISESELARLERELSTASDSHVLVCVHHQVMPVGSPWLDGVGLRNHETVLALLERHDNVRGVLFGHVHQASDRLHGELHVMSTPSTCAQFTPFTRTAVMDLRPPGFRWLELTPTGGINTGVEWLEHWQVTERPPDSRREVDHDPNVVL